MNTLEQMTEHDHQLVAFHQDRASGLRAIVAVHDTTLGPGFGGTRRWAYATEADALHDVLRLSEGMTYKLAAADMPMGGGKAVVLLPKPGFAATEGEARALGRFVQSLGGVYISAEDVGLSPQYVDWMALETKFVTGGETTCPGGDPSPHTARGVFNAMKAALAHTGRATDFHGLTIAIQGAGNVGRSLAHILKDEGATVIVADISSAAVARVVAETAAQAVEPAAILTTRCDILAPCALGGVLNASVIRKLQCPIVCGGANNILEDYDEDGAALQAAGIVYVPDFIANAGGAIHLAGVYVGMSDRELQDRIAAIEHTSLDVLNDTANHPSAYAAAVACARRRIDAGRNVSREQVHAG